MPTAQHHNFKVKNGLEVADSATFSGVVTIEGSSLTLQGKTVTTLLDSADVSAISPASDGGIAMAIALG